MFVSSSGAYLPESQAAYDDEHPIGDYTIRRIPSDTPLSKIAYAHTHYNHQYVEADPQVLVPLDHLRTMVSEGIIGELAPSMISFMGYLPDATRLVDETIPEIVRVAKEEQGQAALLVPAWPICSQSVGLIARALEMEGIATTLSSWRDAVTRLTRPPRATFTRLMRGSTLGQPGDAAQQRRVLEATLALLAQDAPMEPIILNETAE